MTILLIDDDRDWAAAMELYFGLIGDQVVSAANGEEGLALLRVGLRPDVIVLDLSMPHMGGVAFRLRQLAAAPLAAIPLVICSAACDTAATAASLCADAYVEKPVAPATLLRAMRQAVGRPVAVRTPRPSPQPDVARSPWAEPSAPTRSRDRLAT